jgi:type II secretory pathway component HofQ
VRFHDDPIWLAVDRLSQQVLLPVWVDETLVDDETKVTLSQTGPWIEVLDTVLKPTKYRAALFGDDIVWIGPEEERAAAERFLREASGRVHDSGSVLEAVLPEPSSGEFIETSASDVVDYLSDLHTVEFLPFCNLRDLLVTRSFHELPLCLALSLFCEDCGIDWAAMENTIVVGTPEQIGQFHEFCSHRRRQDIRLQSTEDLSNRLNDSLSDQTVLDFPDTPLRDVLDYLCDLHSVHIVTAPEFEETPISGALGRAKFDWALSLLLFRAGLTWDTDGEVIYVGTDRDVAEFCRRTEGRRQKRATYPHEIAGKLTKPVEVYFVETTLAEAVAALAEKSNVRIEITSDQLAAKQLTLATGELPLDVALDLLCLRTNATWRLEADKVVLNPS